MRERGRAGVERMRPEIERASVERDRGPLQQLLAASGLPLDGIADALALAIVAREDGRLAGAAAVEPYGTAGLLRSVVVATDVRGSGLGRRLVAAAEELAASAGIVDLYLLTETAADWFPRLGYARIERSLVPAAVAESVEFRTACPVSAEAFHKVLAPAPAAEAPATP